MLEGDREVLKSDGEVMKKKKKKKKKLYFTIIIYNRAMQMHGVRRKIIFKKVTVLHKMVMWMS